MERVIVRFSYVRVIDSKERSKLRGIAKEVGYFNGMPRYPFAPTTSTLSGYYKRMRNWLEKLNVAIDEYNNQHHGENDDKK